MITTFLASYRRQRKNFYVSLLGPSTPGVNTGSPHGDKKRERAANPTNNIVRASFKE